MRHMPVSRPARSLNAWERNLLGVQIGQAHLLLPGLLLAGLLAWLSIWLSEIIGVTLMGFEKTPVSPVIVAIVLGLVIGNVVSLPAWLRLGFTFAVKKVLRLGIILLGVRLSIFDAVSYTHLTLPTILLV